MFPCTQLEEPLQPAPGVKSLPGSNWNSMKIPQPSPNIWLFFVKNANPHPAVLVVSIPTSIVKDYKVLSSKQGG